MNILHNKINEESLSQLTYIKNNFPNVYNSIDQSLIHRVILRLTNNKVTDFEDFNEGGRGTSYIKAQKNIDVRLVGMESIFNLIALNNNIENFTKEHLVLDGLGGDGLLDRAYSLFGNNKPTIITSDISRNMITEALKSGHIGIRQPVQCLLFKNDSLDAVILAYGTHHIPQNERSEMCTEAVRVLKSGGKILLHDFEENEPVDRWFKEVVDKYSLTGHDIPHFTKQEITSYFSNIKLASFSIKHLYDPFIFYGKSMEEVMYKCSNYLINMYGLEKLKEFYPTKYSQIVFDLAKNIFKYNYNGMDLWNNAGVKELEVKEIDTRYWKLELPRVAIVGLGTKV